MSRCLCCNRNVGKVGAWPWLGDNLFISLCDECIPFTIGKELAEDIFDYANEMFDADLVSFGPVRKVIPVD